MTIEEKEQPKKIDFEKLKYGSFTNQFKAHNRAHKHKLKDLEEFADYIRAHPNDFNARTMKRANFYTNIILKKGGLVETQELLSPTIKRMPNAWISYVKEFAEKKGMKYNEALKHPELKAGYKKGSSSKTHEGEEDFTTKKGDVDFHEEGKDVKKTRKPYTKKGGVIGQLVDTGVEVARAVRGVGVEDDMNEQMRRVRAARRGGDLMPVMPVPVVHQATPVVIGTGARKKRGTGSNTNGGVMVVPMSATPAVKIAGCGVRRKKGLGVINQGLDSGFLGQQYTQSELGQHAGKNYISL
jgi:hypothetical protein